MQDNVIYHKKWEMIYEECCRKDFANKIYKQCDEEDRKETE